MNSGLQAPQGSAVPRPKLSSPPWETEADGILSCEPAASHRGREFQASVYICQDKYPEGSLSPSQERGDQANAIVSR